MMINEFSRFAMLVGEENIEKLAKSKVLVFGVGGVGGYVCEALCRSGVGRIDVVDNDTFSITNINRQILATQDSIGRLKVDVCKERMLSINPKVEVHTYTCFYLPEETSIDFQKYDYIVDAIDTVSGKLSIVENALKLNIPVISSMGTGNRLDPSKLVITDISKTAYDPLARVMRRELKKRGINHLTICYSTEQPLKANASEEESKKRSIPGSSPFVPSSAGLLIASKVVQDLINN